jgi:hypothetical protein
LSEPKPPRQCGACSLCCTVLRVDTLSKLGGVACVHQDRAGPGCAIHAERPGICRAYRCLWLSGALDAADRPDALGAVLDVVSTGPTVQLEIRQARSGVFDASPRLQAIAETFRRTMPVRISDVADVMNPDAPYEMRLPGGEVQRVRGEWTEVLRPGRPPERRRLPALERALRRLVLAAKRLRLARAVRGGPRPARRGAAGAGDQVAPRSSRP